MTDQAWRWISEAEVVELMTLDDAIEALEAGLLLEASGGAKTMPKTQLSWGNGHTIHAVGASFEKAGYVGTKTWAHAGGATPLLILWDSETGALSAIIEAFALGQMRTGSMSALATKIISDRNARTFAMIGTGKQALTQVAAVAAVRDLKEVRVHSPTEKNREAFAQRIADSGFEFDIHPTATLEEAVDGADILTLATRSREPFLFERFVSPGTHVNAVGAISLEREEVAQDLLERCSLIAADNIESARKYSKEFQTYFGPSDKRWETVQPINELVANAWQRHDDTDLTMFKAMGMGLSDLALGVRILEIAKSRSIGKANDMPVRAKPVLRS